MKATRWLVSLSLVAMIGACASTSPVPIRAGDTCFHCRRAITDTRMAAEAISQGRRAYKFSSVGCLKQYLADHPDEQFLAIFVTDHAREKFVEVDKARFVKITVDSRTNATDYVAFRFSDAANAFADERGATVIGWQDVLRDANAVHAH
jgi:copper chaperone NosL